MNMNPWEVHTPDADDNRADVFLLDGTHELFSYDKDDDRWVGLLTGVVLSGWDSLVEHLNTYGDPESMFYTYREDEWS